MKNNNRKVAQKYQWPYLWIRIYIFTLNEEQDKIMEEKEYMLLGLRKIKGIKISEFKNKFIDNPIYLFKNELNKLVKEGLLEVDIDSITLTNKGIDLANLVWEEFV